MTTPMRLCQSQSPDQDRSGCRVMLPVDDRHEIHTDMIKTWTDADVEAWERARTNAIAAEIATHADAVASLIAGMAKPKSTRDYLRAAAVDLARELVIIVELVDKERA